MIVIRNYDSDVAKAVEEGLTQHPKRLPSWLFYDEAGDKIFQSIMKMPEYYLTRCEYEILESNKDNLLRLFENDLKLFNLIDLGAGDGFKTEVLLKHFSTCNTNFIYTPIDVSETVLETLKTRLLKNIPGLSINLVNNRYEDALTQLQSNETRKIFLLLGANIGNFTAARSIDFLRKISAVMSGEDLLVAGFDLKKDPRLIQAAYDDPHGISRKFNLNLLHRLNRELGANFNINLFSHYSYYDPETGVTKSFLVSQSDQDVYFEFSGLRVHFKQWETIHIEISLKYDRSMIHTLANQAGLEVVSMYFDAKNYFCDAIMRSVE